MQSSNSGPVDYSAGHSTEDSREGPLRMRPNGQEVEMSLSMHREEGSQGPHRGL